MISQRPSIVSRTALLCALLLLCAQAMGLGHVHDQTGEPLCAICPVSIDDSDVPLRACSGGAPQQTLPYPIEQPLSVSAAWSPYPSSRDPPRL